MVCVDFHFRVRINLDELDADFGKELEAFLAESVFNGEDVVEVEYMGCKEVV